MFPSIAGTDRYLCSNCPNCGFTCPLDLGETGAIQDPEWLRATELYDWDDDE